MTKRLTLIQSLRAEAVRRGLIRDKPQPQPRLQSTDSLEQLLEKIYALQNTDKPMPRDYRKGWEDACATIIEMLHTGIGRIYGSIREGRDTATAQWYSIESAPCNGQTIEVQAVMLVHHVQGAVFPHMPPDWRPDTPDRRWRFICWRPHISKSGGPVAAPRRRLV